MRLICAKMKEAPTKVIYIKIEIVYVTIVGRTIVKNERVVGIQSDVRMDSCYNYCNIVVKQIRGAMEAFRGK